MEKYKIWVLTLKESKRFKELENYLLNNKFSYNIVYGIDGKNDKNIYNRDKLGFFSKYCTRSMLGCALGHMKIWKKICNTDISDDLLNIIIEDDTYINKDKLTDKLINNIQNFLKNKNNFGIIQLCGADFLEKNTFDIGDGYKLRNSKIHLTLGAYVVNKKSCKLLYDSINVNYHIDFMLNILKLDNYILIPSIASQLGWNDSNMIEKKKILNVLNDKLYYSLTFPIFKIPEYNLIINISCILFLFLFIISYISFLNYNENLKYFTFIWFVLGFLFIDLINFD